MENFEHAMRFRALLRRRDEAAREVDRAGTDDLIKRVKALLDAERDLDVGRAEVMRKLPADG